MHEQPLSNATTRTLGTHDGTGAGDHDQPFAGFRPYHFNTSQLARLLHLRSDALDARLGYGRWTRDVPSANRVTGAPRRRHLPVR